MKRSLSAAALTAAILLLSSCSGAGMNTQNIEKIIDEKTTTKAVQPAEPAQTEKAPEVTQAVTASAADESVDLDLSVMSGTVVYAQVYSMMTEPDEYIGKRIKIKGYFDSVYNADLDVRYYFVIIPDATACCAQGIEFIWDENKHVFPDEYPGEKADIEVTGVFGTYYEMNDKYYYLAVDEFRVLP